MDGDVMNLIAVSFAAVIVVLIAIKIKDMDSDMESFSRWRAV